MCRLVRRSSCQTLDSQCLVKPHRHREAEKKEILAMTQQPGDLYFTFQIETRFMGFRAEIR